MIQHASKTHYTRTAFYEKLDLELFEIAEMTLKITQDHQQ